MRRWSKKNIKNEYIIGCYLFAFIITMSKLVEILSLQKCKNHNKCTHNIAQVSLFFFKCQNFGVA